MRVASLAPTHPVSFISVACPEPWSLCQGLCKVLDGKLERSELKPKLHIRNAVTEAEGSLGL